MTQFIVLYMITQSGKEQMMTSMSPEEQKKDVQNWLDWMEKHSQSFVDKGSPAGKNTRVTAEGTQDSSNDVMGYSIMQAASKEELLPIIQESPHLLLPGTYIEVMKRLEMPTGK